MSLGGGRADYLELGDYNAVCYECGRKRKASRLKKHWQGYYVCPEHWEPRQPQDFVRAVPDVQTPPWTQPMPADAYTTSIVNISNSLLSTGLSGGDFTVTYLVGATDATTDPTGGAYVNGSTVIINIQAGVVVGTLVLDGTWPAGTEIIINNYGAVEGVTNNSGITTTENSSGGVLTVNNFGAYAGLAFKTRFTVQPTDVATSTSISPAVQVAVQDFMSNTVTDYTGLVTVRIGLNPGAATLSGTLSVAAVAGVATFSDLSLQLAGEGYTLIASAEDA